MKICVAQTRPFKGDLQKNIEAHKKLIALAVAQQADLIAFPELSLMGYEPELAKALATHQDDSIFDKFQEISNTHKITIGMGMPTKHGSDIQISMIILQPDQRRQTYSKQHLHSDELPYFVCGHTQTYLSVRDKKIAPAICYESLIPEHAENAFYHGAGIYLASVAKSYTGLQKACRHYADIATKYSMTVLMSNCVGFCDNFESAGYTSVWNNKGVLAGQLDDKTEGVLVFDTDTNTIVEQSL